MNASFVRGIDKWGYSYHHLIFGQRNIYDVTALEFSQTGIS
jgi:hypothetical protein